MLTLWQKRDERKTEDLLPWALSIAKNHARNHVRKVARRGNLTGLTEDTLERVAATQEKLAEQPNQRQQALDHCLEKLPAEHRSLVEEYYDRNLTAEQLATKFNKSVDAFYKSMQRIRRVLFDCINAQLAAGETHGY
jgi:RNA polymerase sigma-70 factor (ECF subfamily)